jgi:hypothetical protein
MNSDIYELYKDFLSGKKLDVSRRFADVSMPEIVRRTDYLRQRCIGKKVLHIGCLDHYEIIPERIRTKTWLHGIVSDVSELCLGIDVDRTSYCLIRREFGVQNVQLLDLSKPMEEEKICSIRQIRWDLILCPEVLEHTTNHQQFLQNLAFLAHHNTVLIITGPNAFQFSNFINTLRRFEDVNSDHKYWFSFYTMSRMLAANGWRPWRLIYYDNPKGRLWIRVLCELAKQMSRAFSDGLIIEATPSEFNHMQFAQQGSLYDGAKGP